MEQFFSQIQTTQQNYQAALERARPKAEKVARLKAELEPLLTQYQEKAAMVENSGLDIPLDQIGEFSSLKRQIEALQAELDQTYRNYMATMLTATNLQSDLAKISHAAAQFVEAEARLNEGRLEQLCQQISALRNEASAAFQARVRLPQRELVEV